MRYIQRDPATNECTGHFANEQSFAMECVEDDHPDILAYKKKIIDERNKKPAMQEVIGSDPFKAALIKFMSKQLKLSEQEILDELARLGGE